MKINDKNGVLKVDETISSLLEELAQEANGPELEKAGELDNEATLEKDPTELTSDIDNEDVYGDDEELAEDVGEVVVEGYTDLELMKYLQENGYEPSIENLLILKEELAQEANGPELDGEGELKNEATEEKEPKELTSDIDNEDVYGDEEEAAEDVGEVVVEGYTDLELMEYLQENGYEPSIENLLILKEELAQEANGPELEKAGELDNEATLEKAPKELTSDIDNEDIYGDDEEAAEDVGEVVVENSLMEDELETNPLEKEAEDAGVADDKPADDGDVKESEDDEEKEDKKEDDEDKEDSKEEDDEKEQTNENALFDFINSINESLAQEANGPELDGEGELKNEATEEKEAKTEKANTKNDDVYCDCSHKQVEDVVETVVEAVSVCKANGVPATLENITEAAVSLFETKNFDIDAMIMSKEWNGSKKFDEYKDIEGDGANAALTGLRKTKSYKSLKEACMMDDGYFAEDSYTVETAAEKTAKLTEQVSLLIARENNDPLYDELLKESAYCMRLREQIQNKYNRSAISKVNDITK